MTSSIESSVCISTFSRICRAAANFADQAGTAGAKYYTKCRQDNNYFDAHTDECIYDIFAIAVIVCGSIDGAVEPMLSFHQYWNFISTDPCDVRHQKRTAHQSSEILIE